jgi:glucose-6-phosphate isomerase, archaeal
MTDCSPIEQNTVMNSRLLSLFCTEFKPNRGANSMQEPFTRPGLGNIDWSDGSLHGPLLRESAKTLGQLRGIFRNEREWERSDPKQVVYRVQWIPPVADETQGGLIWGNTTIEPGRIGDEYFMTHGHFHAIPDRSEFYLTIRGSGLLVLMDRNRNGWTEQMIEGSIHYIHADVAHRVVNCGNDPLRFIACWPSDAGHDYASILKDGFSLRVIDNQGHPSITPAG